MQHARAGADAGIDQEGVVDDRHGLTPSPGGVGAMPPASVLGPDGVTEALHGRSPASPSAGAPQGRPLPDDVGVSALLAAMALGLPFPAGGDAEANPRDGLAEGQDGWLAGTPGIEGEAEALELAERLASVSPEALRWLQQRLQHRHGDLA